MPDTCRVSHFLLNGETRRIFSANHPHLDPHLNILLLHYNLTSATYHLDEFEMPSKTPYFGFSKVMLADLGDADQIKAIFTIPTNPIPPPIADILAVHAYSESPLDAIRSSTLVDQLCEAYKATWSPQTRAWLARHHPDTSAPDRSMALVKTAVTLMENLPPILGTYGGSKITSHGSVSRWLQDISDIRPSLVLREFATMGHARL